MYVYKCITSEAVYLLIFSVVGQLYLKTNKQTYRKHDQICGYQRQGYGEGECGQKVQTASGQKVQTASYKINKY